VLDQSGYKADQAKPVNQMLSPVAAVVIGAGVGVATPLGFTLLARTAPPDRMGRTMGAAEVGREVGDSGGPLVVGAFDWSASPPGSPPSPPAWPCAAPWSGLAGDPQKNKALGLLCPGVIGPRITPAESGAAYPRRPASFLPSRATAVPEVIGDE
jgi:hypothetical protein